MRLALLGDPPQRRRAARRRPAGHRLAPDRRRRGDDRDPRQPGRPEFARSSNASPAPSTRSGWRAIRSPSPSSRRSSGSATGTVHLAASAGVSGRSSPADYPPPKHRARHGNHPADSVNWYDAIGLLPLAERASGLRGAAADGIRVAAAPPPAATPRAPIPGARTGTRSRNRGGRTPSESELGRSTAVGMYPAGCLPVGDPGHGGHRLGVVPERIRDPDNDRLVRAIEATVHEDRRVLRGGSWFDDQGYARSAGRGWNYPTRPGPPASAFVWCVRPHLEH